MDSPPLATEAAAEWNAAARNRRTVSRTGPENGTPPAEVWVEYTRNATALADQLRSIPRDDHATWAKAARDVSGAFAAWSYRLEATPGPWRPPPPNCPAPPSSGHPRQHGKPVTLPSIAGTAMLFMAASSKDKTAAQTALMVQLINTAFAVYEMHSQSGRTREAQRIRAVVEQRLAPFTATMPQPVLVGAGQQPAPEAAVPPRAVDIARRGMAPLRPGSAVPTTPTPATPATTYQPGRRDAGQGLDR